MYSVANVNTVSLMVQNLSFIGLEKRFDTANQISIKYRTRPIDIPVNYRGFCSEIEDIKSTCPYNFFLSTLFLIGEVDRIRRNVKFDVSTSSFINNLIKLYTTSSDNQSELLFLTVYNSDSRLRERMGHLHNLRKKLDSDIITLELLEAFAVCFLKAVTVRREEQKAKISWIEPQLNEKYNLRIPLDDILKYALKDLDFFESLLLSRAELYRLVDCFFRSVSNDIDILYTSPIATKKVLSLKNTAAFDSILPQDPIKAKNLRDHLKDLSITEATGDLALSGFIDSAIEHMVLPKISAVTLLKALYQELGKPIPKNIRHRSNKPMYYEMKKITDNYYKGVS